MALLISLGCVGCIALGACSLVLDPDDLQATLLVTRDATDGGDLDASLDTREVSPDTSPPDVAPETTDTGATLETVDDVAIDTTVEPEVIVRYSGQSPSTCTLDYKIQAVTACPVSCPDNEGWTLVIDASESVGIGAFNWRFGATDGYGVSPTQASGPRVELNVTVPDCELIVGTGMGPGSIAVELSTDGGAFVPQPAIRWSVRSVSQADCTDQDDCPGP